MIPGINERFSSLISQSQTTRRPGNCASVAPISKKHVVVATAKQALSCPNICKKWGLLLKSFWIFPQKMLFLSASCPLLLFAVRELSGAVQHLKRLAFQVNIFVDIAPLPRFHVAHETFRLKCPGIWQKFLARRPSGIDRARVNDHFLTTTVNFTPELSFGMVHGRMQNTNSIQPPS